MFHLFPSKSFSHRNIFFSSLLNTAIAVTCWTYLSRLKCLLSRTKLNGLVFVVAYFNLVIYHRLFRGITFLNYFLFPWGFDKAEEFQLFVLQRLSLTYIEKTTYNDIRVHLWLSERGRNWNERCSNVFPVCLSQNFYFLNKLFGYDHLFVYTIVWLKPPEWNLESFQMYLTLMETYSTPYGGPR